MEELRAKLKEIKDEMEELEEITKIMQRETGILEAFDEVNKEVV